MVDLTLLLVVAPLHPLCFTLVLLQWFARRSATVAGSVVALLGDLGLPAVAERPLTRALLPGLPAPAAPALPAPVYTVEALPAPDDTAPVSLPAPEAAGLVRADTPPPLPGTLDFADLLGQGFVPTPQRILLGVGPQGIQYTTSVTGLCHVAICGATGGGKSNLHRLILPQLLAIGARVWLADPHHAPFDPESGDDWRPLVSRLDRRPAVRPSEMDAMLDALIAELEHRLERRRRGEPIGDPLFFAFDELPVVVEQVKHAAERVTRILREGRKVKVLTIGASQDFLCKTIGSTSAVRDCYRTAYYVGGDRVSAATLCDVPQRQIDDGPLGAGVALLRSTATPTATLVRVPLASNEAMQELLAAPARAPLIPPLRAGGVPSMPLPAPGDDLLARLLARPIPDSAAPAPDTAEEWTVATVETAAARAGRDPDADRIMRLFREGKSVQDIASKDYNCPLGGRRYREMRTRVEQVIRQELLAGTREG